MSVRTSRFLTASLLVSCVLTEAASGQSFTRVNDIGPIVTDAFLSTGASWNDFNGDGLLDLFALGETSNHLYINLGDGTFAAATTGTFVEPRGVSNAALWADFDDDGDEDLFISNFASVPGGSTPAPNVLYTSGGSPSFGLTEMGLEGSVNASPSASWVDYDQDGDLDLYAAGGGTSSGVATQDLFHRQDASGVFRNLTGKPFLASRRGVGTHDTWVDYDGDGDQDLYVVNWRFENNLYRSQLVETGNPDAFVEVMGSGLTDEGTLLDIGSNWGDYDNDGDLDVFIPMLNTTDRLFRNEGDGTFSRVTGTAVGSQRSVVGVWGDYDNDGDLDLYAGGSSAKLYRNDGNEAFVEAGAEVGSIRIAPPALQAGNWGDYDNDGDLDLYLLTYAVPQNRNGTPQANRMYRNDGGTNHWLTFKTVGVVSNRPGIGARVEVKASIGGAATWQVREVSGGTSSFVFQGDRRSHFGLGDATVADSVRIRWPSGIVQVLTDVAADQILVVEEEVPADFLRANFYAEDSDVHTTGDRTVQFRNTTQAGSEVALTWEWDFENDGVVDDTSEEPIRRYTAARDTTFSVSLVVTSSNGSSRLVREQYISVDGIPTPLEEELVPGSVALKAVYPNPFNEATNIVLEIGQAGLVGLEVFDVIGRRVRTLVNGLRRPGQHRLTWNGLNQNGQAVPAGIYFLVLTDSNASRVVESVHVQNR